MTTIQIVTTLIFVGAYVFIASEKIHKTTVALAGATLMLLLGGFGVDILTQQEALHGVHGVHAVE